MFKYELKRVFSNRINQILLVLVILSALVYSGFAIFSKTYVDEDGQSVNSILATRLLVKSKMPFSGDLTEEKLEQVVAQNQKVDIETATNQDYATFMQPSSTISEFINKMIVSDSDYNPYAIYDLPIDQANSLYKKLQENQKQFAETNGKTEEKKEFIENQFNKTHLPITYYPVDSWEAMTTLVTTYSLILIIIASFMTASIFSEEFRLKTNNVFFSTRLGQTKAIWVKLLVGLSLTSLIYLIGMIILSLVSLSVMGISGFNTPYLMEIPNSLYALSYGQLYLLIILSGYVATILSATIAMYVSAITKSATIATCVPFLFFCVLPFVGRLFDFSSFFQLTPDNLVNIINTIRKPYLYQIGSIVFRQIPFVIGFYLLLSLILLPATYLAYKKKGSKK